MDKFVFIIEDKFKLSGIGTVVTGYVDSGRVSVGDSVYVEIINGSYKTVEIRGIEKFRKKYDDAIAGDHCGIILSDINTNEIRVRGIVTKLEENERNGFDPLELKTDTEITIQPTKKLKTENKKWWQKLF